MHSSDRTSFKYTVYKVGKLYICPEHFPIMWPTLEMAIDQVKSGNKTWVLGPDPESWILIYSQMVGYRNIKYFDGNHPTLLTNKYEMTYWGGVPLLHFLAAEASGWVLPLEIFSEVK